MRVRHVIAWLSPHMGGLPKAALSMALAQQAAGADSGIVYGVRGEDVQEIRDHFHGLPGFEGLRRVEVPMGSLGAQVFAGAFLETLAGEKPEVVHVHGLWEPVLWRVQGWAGRKGIPYVISPHSMLHPWQNGHHRAAKFVFRKVLGWERGWRGAAWVHGLSEAERVHLEQQGLERVRVFPNGVFAEEDLEPLGEELQGLAGRPFVLFLGRLDRVKGVDRLLEAFARVAGDHRELFLVLAGPDYGMRDGLSARAEALGLGGRVVFPGVLRGRELWAALHHTVCFCLPSLSEGCSLAVLEAGLAGAPVAMSGACDLEGWFAEGAAVRLPEDVEGMAEVLVSLAGDPQRGAAMGRVARRLVRERYGWPSIAAAQLEAYAGCSDQ